MASIFVNNIPERLYKQFQKVAAGQGRSISAQIILLMEETIRKEEARKAQAALIEDIQKRRWTPPPDMPDAVELLKQVRNERVRSVTSS